MEVNEMAVLRRICDSATYTKQHIAAKIGINVVTLNKFIKGESNLRSYNLNKIKHFLRLDLFNMSGSQGVLTADEWVDFIIHINHKLKN